MSIELDDVIYAPGAEVSGRVRVEADHDRVRSIRVELARRDSSARSRTTGFDVLTKAELAAPGTEPAPFSLTVPDAALPGFSGRYSKVEWLIRAAVDVSGIDPTTTAGFEVSAPPEPVIASAQQRVPSELRDQAARPSRPQGQVFDTVILLGLIGFGIWIIGAGLNGYFNGDGKGALGFALIGVPFIAVMVWMLLQRYPLKPRGVAVEPDQTVLSRGQTVRASVSVTKPGMAIGLRGIERYAEDRRSEHGRNVVYPEHVFHEAWLEVERGETEVEFDIPADARVTYQGTAVLIDWYLVVLRDKHRTRTKTVSQHRTRLLVLY